MQTNHISITLCKNVDVGIISTFAYYLTYSVLNPGKENALLALLFYCESFFILLLLNENFLIDTFSNSILKDNSTIK